MIERHVTMDGPGVGAPGLTVAYPWIGELDYARARQLMIDGDLWPSDYEVWRREALRAMKALSTEGVVPLKVTLDLEAFTAWCRVNDYPADSAARLSFAEAIAWERSDATRGV